MSKTLLTCALIGAAGLASAASAQDTLANWTFEVSIPSTAGPHMAEAGVNAAISAATGLHASGATAYSNPVGNGSNESFSSNNWQVGDYYQFTTSTVGYEALTITWDQTSSSTGPRDWSLAWSTDGSSFTPFLDYQVLQNGLAPNANWSSVTNQPAYTLGPQSLPGALENQATIYIRMVQRTNLSMGGVNPVATTGANRVDNVIIQGELVPAPGAAALIGLGGLLAARRRRA